MVNGVWEGRFQPIHIGHLSYIKKLLDLCDTLWIYVLANETSDKYSSDELPFPTFSKVVDEHHRVEKNPLPHWLRFKMVSNVIKYEFGEDAPIYLSMGGRMDLNWDYYKSALPDDRVFFTPLRDGFEDLKANTWLKAGEICQRVGVGELPKISATEVRSLIHQGSPEIRKYVSRVTYDELVDFGYINDC